ncbi:hypothetical protein LCGC14_1101040 [marine sediment metagenome]|uniref:DUF559 domain-containing protein n=1 Tax=marine sediment metagenome TaxID=412755 RepID=A0A0F9MXA2_9ZZZZ
MANKISTSRRKSDGRGGWNTGLSKETDSRVAASAKKISQAMRKIKLSGGGWNKGLTKETDYRVRKNGESLLGHPVSEKTKDKISKRRRDHLTKDPNGCRCGPHLRETGQRQTQIERILREVLLSEFPEVVSEKRFGFYRVDAYLPPPYHLAFEADGSYWHALHEQENPGCYQRRDNYLMKHFALPVIRLTEDELRMVENVSG